MLSSSRRQFLLNASMATAATLLSHPRGAAAIQAQSPDGSAVNSRRLDSGWQFRLGPTDGIWEAWRSEENALWESVTLPHCFNAGDACDPDHPYFRGQGWYRSRLTLDNPFAAGRTLRVGFTFDPYGSGKTVFHGGAGLFFDSISGNEWMLSQNFQPFAVRETNAFTHVVSLQNIYTTDCQDFAGCVSPFPFVYSPTNPRYVSPASLVFVQQGMRWPYNIQANFGVQQQFGNNLALSINYVGAFSRKIPLYIDHNAPIYNTTNIASNTTGDVNCRRPYQAIPFATGSTTTCASPAVGSKYYSNAYVIEDGQTTDYNGLQVSVTKRLSQHISLNGFYIWSKALASASLQTTGNIGNSAGTEPEDYYDLALERQRTDNDQREQAVISGVWKPDYFGGFNPVVRNVLGGWSIAAIVTMRSGKPFNITTGTDDNFDGDTNDRPNILPGKRASVLDNSGSRSAEKKEWFDTTVYCKNGAGGCPAGAGPSGLDGLVRDNSLDSPGYKDVDASIFRDFTVYERVKFQFRGEATNVFNFVNLSAPGGTLSSTSSFGIISGASSMRVIQVGGRLLF